MGFLKRVMIGAAIGSLMLAAEVRGAEPVLETVTYQGVLNDGGSPANGMYDVRFQYFDELGNPFLATQTYLEYEIVDGLISLPIQFTNVFGFGDRRFLQVSVRPSGTTVFSDLSPRQEITAAPYSVYAIKAGEAETSLDNEWSRSSNILSAGDTNESILLNPELNSGSMLNEFTVFQVNFDRSGFGGMYLNSVNSDGFPFYGFASDSVIRGFVSYNTADNAMQFFNNESAGVDLEITDVATEARNLSSKDKIVKDFGSNEFYHSGPVAYGTVSSLGFKTSGTPNFTVSFDTIDDIYTINIDGESFNFNDYTALVTPIGLGLGLPVTFGTASSGDDLLIRFYSVINNTTTSSTFQFAVYRGLPVDLE